MAHWRDPRRFRTRQIIPATGWSAVFRGEDGSELISPLAVWALVEDTEDGEDEVVGLDGGDWLEPADHMGNFVEYRYGPGQEEGRGAL